MNQRLNQPATRRHIEIYDEDWKFLSENFGKNSSHPIGVGPTIRQLVHVRVKGLRANFEAKLDRETDAERYASAQLAEKMKGG